VDARVLDSGFVVSEGESEQSGGVEDGAVESSLLLVVNGAFPSGRRRGLGDDASVASLLSLIRLGGTPDRATTTAGLPRCNKRGLHR